MSPFRSFDTCSLEGLLHHRDRLGCAEHILLDGRARLEERRVGECRRLASPALDDDFEARPDEPANDVGDERDSPLRTELLRDPHLHARRNSTRRSGAVLTEGNRRRTWKAARWLR